MTLQLSRIGTGIAVLFELAIPASAQWCEGREAVALIADSYLTANARAQVERLLKESPVAIPHSAATRPGCILSALRYLKHFAGDPQN